ncbi:hypothetical protein GGD67_002769 [Bradyrhizobium sp. IAR9]|uniref:hypothetical protein n=1 Tax=Bradyrhizobium sp. IAR9 TaxID=2663841 RepID=UPI0015CBA27B|nr:hypothetical protein [Bradyrhizobium sp. IAR9]NYG45311.1 hypothetical protein [Bradyrhizobium sp. IAR9]
MLTCGARQQALTIRNKVFQAALSTAMLSMMTTAAAALDQDRRLPPRRFVGLRKISCARRTLWRVVNDSFQKTYFSGGQPARTASIRISPFSVIAGPEPDDGHAGAVQV